MIFPQDFCVKESHKCQNEAKALEVQCFPFVVVSLMEPDEGSVIR